ncbi:MAG: hypothetical protein ACTSYW_01475 [Candidatus Heimdallarchaeota archaeon]
MEIKQLLRNIAKYQKAMDEYAIFPTQEDYSEAYKYVFNEKHGSIRLIQLVFIDKINRKYLSNLFEIEARISVLEDTDDPPDLSNLRVTRKKLLEKIFEKFAKEIIILEEMSASEVVRFFEKY